VKFRKKDRCEKSSYCRLQKKSGKQWGD